MRRLIACIAVLLAATVLTVNPALAAKLDSQTSSQSGVTVKVAPQNLAGAQWEFSVVFDTHSQDLSDDLMKSATLVLDGGAPLAPLAWQGDAAGGHHRKGLLRFKAPAQSPASVELRLKRPGEVAPRVFRWQLR
ncbi:MAG TPA: hypothetical protein VFX67_06295 [Burkholderiales bacterium]|nr:hypothetical protein [Burkholderiales bacterium]